MYALAAALAVGLLAAATAPAPAHAGEVRQQRVTFAKGATAATLKGQLKGRETVDYQVRAGAGQTMKVTLTPSHPQNYFNVLPPESGGAAMYQGQTGEGFEGMLPADGDYTVRVYLMPAAARRDERSNFTLTIGVTGSPLVALPASQDAVLPGTRFHAKTSTDCTLPYRSGPVSCESFVTRRGRDGTATVEIRSDGKPVRRVLFVKGKLAASDSPQPLVAERDGDRTVVRIGSDERFVVHDALLTGG